MTDSYKCVSEKFLSFRNNKSKKKEKESKKNSKSKKNEHKKKQKNEKNRMDTRSNISLGSSVNRKTYINFSRENNMLLIYCLYKKIKKYNNFYPVTVAFNKIDKIVDFYDNIETNITIPGKIKFLGINKHNAMMRVKKLLSRPERFLIFYLRLELKNYPGIPRDSAHANLLIFDTEKNEVYHFEPHGVNDFISPKQFKELIAFFSSISPDCKFYKHKDYLKLYPFQNTDTDHEYLYGSKIKLDIGGYCFYWCFYILNMILKFSYLPIPEIIKQLYERMMHFSVSKAKFTDFHRAIRSWGQTLEQDMKKHFPKQYCVDQHYKSRCLQIDALEKYFK